LILVDTHVLLWWVAAPEHLSASAQRALREADEIGVPAITFWEIAVLNRRRRIALGEPVSSWAKNVLAIPRLRCVPATCAVTAFADEIAMHPDPADRFIVATAIDLGVPLVTRDRHLRKLKIVKTIW
jgi:PIN domain nuclease of toxin-antitoxin system